MHSSINSVIALLKENLLEKCEGHIHAAGAGKRDQEMQGWRHSIM
jgi:hypothetical protein